MNNKFRNIILTVIILVALVLIISGSYFLFIRGDSSKDDKPSGDEPLQEIPSNAEPSGVTEKDFNLYKEEGLETSIIVQSNDQNSSDVYVLMINHDSNMTELKNFTLDVFSPEKEYITSKHFESVTLGANEKHLFEWHIDIPNLDASQIEWHMSY